MPGHISKKDLADSRKKPNRDGKFVARRENLCWKSHLDQGDMSFLAYYMCHANLPLDDNVA